MLNRPKTVDPHDVSDYTEWANGYAAGAAAGYVNSMLIAMTTDIGEHLVPLDLDCYRGEFWTSMFLSLISDDFADVLDAAVTQGDVQEALNSLAANVSRSVLPKCSVLSRE